MTTLLSSQLFKKKKTESPQIGSQTQQTTSSGSPSFGGETHENIKVAVRVRPFLNSEQEYEETVSVLGDNQVIVKKGSQRSQLSFDRVFPKETSQEEVYMLVNDTIEAVLNGYNATVFAYGQTGTGKTYTMLGIDFNCKDAKIPPELLMHPENFRNSEEYQQIQEKKGIIPRSVEHILMHIKRTSHTTKYKLYCSYLEIYNEKIYDLLNDDKNVHLEIREDKNRGLYVQDLTTILVSKEQDIYELMQEGARNRSVAQTDMNERSSRSHTIFQLFIEQEPIASLESSSILQEEKVSKVSKLNLVDLAGSEKWNTFSKFKMEDKRIQELTSINQSLSTLGNCISALMQQGRQHIPYRNSKLTRLLQDSLGGNTKTLFLATISPSVLAFEETVSTLKFADRAMRVVVTTHVNEVVDDGVLIRRYEKEISRLRKLLKQNGNYESKVKGLIIENHKLRDDNEKLVNYIKLNANKTEMGAQAEAPRAENERPKKSFQKKLEMLEQIEADQKARESELDRYHQWLHSIPVKVENNEYSLELKERLVLVEGSVKMQVNELERTKKLFMRDLKIIQTELNEKTEELKHYKELEKKNQDQIRALEQQLKEAQVRAPTGSSSSHHRFSDEAEQDDSVQKEKLVAQQQAILQKDISKLLECFENSKDKINNKLGSGLEAFRKNLGNILQDHVASTMVELQPEERKQEIEEHVNLMKAEISQLVEGCSEALDETFKSSLQDHNEKISGVLKRLFEILLAISKKNTLLILKQKKLKAALRKSVKEEACQTDLEWRDEGAMAKEVKEILKEVGSLPDEKSVKSYWRNVVDNVSELREYQSQLYINALSIKNSLLRTVDVIKSFEYHLQSNNSSGRSDNATKQQQDTMYHRQYLQNVLDTMIRLVDQFERKTFLRPKQTPDLIVQQSPFRHFSTTNSFDPSVSASNGWNGAGTQPAGTTAQSEPDADTAVSEDMLNIFALRSMKSLSQSKTPFVGVTSSIATNGHEASDVLLQTNEDHFQ